MSALGNEGSGRYCNVGEYLANTFDRAVVWSEERPHIACSSRRLCEVQDVDRYSPAWWYADVPETAIIPLRKLEAVLPYLRQVCNHSLLNCLPCLTCARCAQGA